MRRELRSARYWFQVASSTASVNSTLDLAAAASYPALMIASASSKLSAPHFCTGTETRRSAFHAPQFVGGDHDRDRLAEYRERGEIGIRFQRSSARWTPRITSGPMLFCYLDGNVLQQSAVSVDGTSFRTGVKRPGSDMVERNASDRDPSRKTLGFAADQISGHAGKRNGQIVEALDFRVGSATLSRISDTCWPELNPAGNCSPLRNPNSRLLG